jgi:hypothetical protein
MALTTPINLTQRGLLANTGVNTSKYPHTQTINDTGLAVLSAVFHAADATVVKGAAIAVNDVFPLLTIPAGALVLAVVTIVSNAEGGTFTYDIGDAADPNGFVSGANGNTTTNASSFNATTTPAFGAGKYYAAASTIDLLVASGTATAAIVKVSVAYIKTLPFVS